MPNFEVTDGNGDWENTVKADNEAQVREVYDTTYEITNIGEHPVEEKDAQKQFLLALGVELERRQAEYRAYDLGLGVSVIFSASRHNRSDLASAVSALAGSPLTSSETIPIMQPDLSEVELTLSQAETLSALVAQRLTVLQRHYNFARRNWAQISDVTSDQYWTS